MSESIRVALTFDAEHPDRPLCPPDASDRILDALADAAVRATIFVQGRWAEAYPERARRIASDGHLVGHHSKYHARMPLLHDEGFREDVSEGADAILQACGVDPRPWFRCPFGAGHDDPRVLGLLEELGYRNVHYHVVLDDWEPWRTGPQITDDAVAGVLEQGDGAVVLMHTWPGPTADSLPGVIGGLIEAGATFVTVDALEALP
ncbi:MAG: polysaccharide deacetylase family protein [Actinobacteria bacterium]|nr:polysaccharide deacetylase family protein [Actinomycetota bacterium]